MGNSNRSRMSCPLLEMILVKLLWIVFTKKMLSKGEINTRPCVKFVKAIPNDVWINSKICKRLFLSVNLSKNLHICVYNGAFKKICNQFFVKLKIYTVFLKNN